MKPEDLIEDLRSRIDKRYANRIGTESWERKRCADALESMAYALAACHTQAVAIERERIVGLLRGIDKEECADPDGWWETSVGAEFGAGVLCKITGGEPAPNSPHAQCKTPDECRKEQCCHDGWNCG